MHKYELVATGLDPEEPFRFESSLSSNISSFKIENLLDGMKYEIKLNAIPISKSINSPPNIVMVEAMTEYAPPILKTKYVGIDTFIFGWESPRVPNLSLALRYMSFDSFETNMDFTNWIQVNKNENSFTLDSLLPHTKYLMEARFVETKPTTQPEVEPEIESQPEVDQKQNPDWEPKYSESELLEFQTDKITVPKVANPFITSVTYGSATIIWDEPKTDLEIDGYIILYGPEDSPSYIKPIRVDNTDTIFELDDLDEDT